MNTQLLRRVLHRSWGIGGLCVGVLVGVASAQIITLRLDSGIALFVACIVVTIILLIRVRQVTILAIVLVAFCLGMQRGSHVRQELMLTSGLVGRTVTIRGIINEDPQISARGDQRIILNKLRIDTVDYQGSLWTSGAKGEYKRGDTMTMSGLLRSGFATHQLSMYRPKVESVFKQKDPIIAFRDSFASAVRQGVVEPAASLGIGFVIGQKSALPPELEEQLRVVGLTHLVVASGYNLTILIRFAKRLFEKHSRFLVNASSITMMTGFVMVSGASPSMVRASIVSGLSLLVWNYGRTVHPILLILFVAALTALYQPNYLWSDLGWWLSFLAFFGVLVVSPLSITFVMKLRKQSDNKSSSVVQLVSETVAAQIMTLPIVLYSFGLLPVTALVANMITAPLIPFAMAATGIAGLVTLLAPGLAGLISLPATVLLSYFVAVVRTLANIPWALQEITMSVVMMIGIYIGIASFVYIVWCRLRYNFRDQSIID